MNVILTKHAKLLVISTAIFWLLVAAGTGWYFYSKYKYFTQPDSAKLKEAAVQLDTTKLEEALKLLSGNN